MLLAHARSHSAIDNPNSCSDIIPQFRNDDIAATVDPRIGRAHLGLHDWYKPKRTPLRSNGRTEYFTLGGAPRDQPFARWGAEADAHRFLLSESGKEAETRPHQTQTHQTRSLESHKARHALRAWSLCFRSRKLACVGCACAFLREHLGRRDLRGHSRRSGAHACARLRQASMDSSGMRYCDARRNETRCMLRGALAPYDGLCCMLIPIARSIFGHHLTGYAHGCLRVRVYM